MLKNNYETGSRGFLYYAHNNDIINYLRLAICSATTGKFQIPTFRAMVVTDDKSLSSLSDEDKKRLTDLFEVVKINNDYEHKVSNRRLIMDGDKRHGVHSWHNGTRSNALTDSIYDETIMIDVDFVFQDNNLDKLWGSESPLMMNKYIVPIINNIHSQKSKFKTSDRLGNFSLPMYWATVVYFNRCEFTETFFELVSYIKDNYFYFQKLYQVADNAYRNDYSFSMALFICNGNRMPGPEWEIPYNFVLSTQKDEVARIDKGQIKLIISTYDWKAPKQMFNVQKMSLHCMNKVSLLDRYEEFMAVYNDE